MPKRGVRAMKAIICRSRSPVDEALEWVKEACSSHRLFDIPCQDCDAMMGDDNKVVWAS